MTLFSIVQWTVQRRCCKYFIPYQLGSEETVRACRRSQSNVVTLIQVTLWCGQIRAVEERPISVCHNISTEPMATPRRSSSAAVHAQQLVLTRGYTPPPLPPLFPRLIFLLVIVVVSIITTHSGFICLKLLQPVCNHEFSRLVSVVC